MKIFPKIYKKATLQKKTAVQKVDISAYIANVLVFNLLR